MARVHYLKRSRGEAVLKCYDNSSSPDPINISLSDLVADGETFDANTAFVSVKELFWGAKVGKQIDITRKDPDSEDTHGHYYLVNTGSYDYNGFVDDAYSDWDIRIEADGPFHVIIKLNKTGGYNT